MTTCAIFLIIACGSCFSQTNSKERNPTFVNSSPAFAEVLLKRTELEAELEELLVAYTLEFPKVKQIQFELKLINTEMDRLYAVKASESQKLTLALGKLIVRKVELESELWNLQKQYGDDHPNVKKAKRKVLVYDSAIKDVLF